jgi:hypothetical protein
MRPDTGLGILSLQFAGSASALNGILTAWRDLGVIAIARESLLTDFPFMVAYAGNLALGGLLLADSRSSGRRMALLAFCCVPFDAAENAVQMSMLEGGATVVSAQLNFMFVGLKFSTVLATAVFLARALLRFGKLRRQRRTRGL